MAGSISLLHFYHILRNYSTLNVETLYICIGENKWLIKI